MIPEALLALAGGLIVAGLIAYLMGGWHAAREIVAIVAIAAMMFVLILTAPLWMVYIVATSIPRD